MAFTTCPPPANSRATSQLRERGQRRRIAAHFLSYWAAVESGCLPAAPIDYAQPLLLSNNLCSLPLEELTRELVKSLDTSCPPPSSLINSDSSSAASSLSSCAASDGADVASGAEWPLDHVTACARDHLGHGGGSSRGCLAFIPPNLGDNILILPSLHTITQVPTQDQKRSWVSSGSGGGQGEDAAGAGAGGGGGGGGVYARGSVAEKVLEIGHGSRAIDGVSASRDAGHLVVWVSPPLGSVLPEADALGLRELLLGRRRG